MTSQIIRKLEDITPPPQWQLMAGRMAAVVVAAFVASYLNANNFDTEILVVLVVFLSQGTSEWATNLIGKTPPKRDGSSAGQ